MKRRVVVTGIGAVSPNGIGREKFWQATRNGTSGVRNITRFDASGYAVQVAGEVVDFDESLYVSAKDRQHVSRAVPLGIVDQDTASRCCRGPHFLFEGTRLRSAMRAGRNKNRDLAGRYARFAKPI